MITSNGDGGLRTGVVALGRAPSPPYLGGHPSTHPREVFPSVRTCVRLAHPCQHSVEVNYYAMRQATTPHLRQITIAVALMAASLAGSLAARRIRQHVYDAGYVNGYADGLTAPVYEGRRHRRRLKVVR